MLALKYFVGGVNILPPTEVGYFPADDLAFRPTFDSSVLLNNVSKLSASANAKDLGSPTISMLKGKNGKQRKELRKLVQWPKIDYPT